MNGERLSVILRGFVSCDETDGRGEYDDDDDDVEISSHGSLSPSALSIIYCLVS